MARHQRHGGGLRRQRAADVAILVSIFNFQFASLLALGAAAIWAATHYTLGKKPYGYVGLGDLFVFIFFGLVSVLGSYFVIAHTLDFRIWLLAPAVGMGLLSVAVLNVNNIRDMQSDEGIRKTVPLRIGRKAAQWYQTFLVVAGTLLMCACNYRWWYSFAVGGIAVHLWMVWTRKGRRLDPALPILVLSTFLLALLYAL
ncbi:MAG: 1,4-dihydroxy-2-naphthoate octaprenyltransferase [Bacteroidales bacterium]|nr:1,4-dihydroxy-2-naphthoate octaprenyltransferase [Bacteroidales bacterium]